MANFQDVVNYFRPYWKLSVFSIAASSIYEIFDLVVPYAIGQILNILSNQPIDRPLTNIIDATCNCSNNICE
ncbi:MAG: ABC transporter ATP-binding protein, partial [Cyanobacteria bacterium J06639_18]